MLPLFLLRPRGHGPRVPGSPEGGKLARALSGSCGRRCLAGLEAKAASSSQPPSRKLGARILGFVLVYLFIHKRVL